jgi:hypothetical protein
MRPPGSDEPEHEEEGGGLGSELPEHGTGE